MENTKEVLKVSGWIVLALFIIGSGVFAFKAIFLPVEKAIEREVFEESKSYVHGKVGELAKYYEQYVVADSENKGIIKNVIQMQFAEFNVKHIDNMKLRSFLIETRGY